ncbi:cache domain-containing sensor histidine kinase [Clostridium estertheticum]|uniref:Sensor histidine kinase n=1 Tax=Clostridium estertheticum TaxID=238834 RepID=A0A7Y3T0X4_9CLOT|nr:sensor histidine kinase [Clostridium estertheticum]NNU78663.1 sensor histidine kinase [Clostridium estertheticum]WBL46702.1 sensor histidine kinase [Clostridium estertheticum]
MNKFVKIFLDRSIKYKLSFYFSLVILIPIVTISILGNLLYKNSITNQQNENIRQMVSQISNNIDFYIKDTENIINYLSEDPRILSFLGNNTNSSIIKKDIESMRVEESSKAINSFTTFHSEIAGIMIVKQDDTFVSDVMGRISRDALTKEKWYLDAAKNPITMHLFSKPVGRNINNVFQYSADDVVSMSKAVVDKKTGKCIGVILIDMKLDIIKSVIEHAKPAKNGFVYIVDNNGEIVYSPVNKIVYRIKSEWTDNSSGEILIKRIKENDYKIIHGNSTYTGWKTVEVFPLNESLRVIDSLVYYSIIIAIITLLIAEILATFFTRSIVGPISKLKSLMKKTEEGNFNVVFNSKYDDEIGELGNAFNNMVREIKNLIMLVETEGKKKRKAEISILHAQIKPHFIYNTLDTIQWMAQEHDAQDIVDITYNLTNLLRIGLSAGEENIKISQEIKHVESYLLIQKIRYEDKLNYEINMQKEILNLSVIKLILQPIVENAIYHGIKEKRGSGHIKISGMIENEKICFVIQDNGIGIEDEKLMKINEMLKGKTTSNDVIGYGIFNVNEKIKLTYGEEFGLEYHSIYGEGTTVVLWHPIIKNE